MSTGGGAGEVVDKGLSDTLQLPERGVHSEPPRPRRKASRPPPFYQRWDDRVTFGSPCRTEAPRDSRTVLDNELTLPPWSEPNLSKPHRQTKHSLCYLSSGSGHFDRGVEDEWYLVVGVVYRPQKTGTETLPRISLEESRRGPYLAPNPCGT